MQYKILNPPQREHRSDGAKAKLFEQLLNAKAAEGWRLLEVTVNGWVVMERDETRATPFSSRVEKEPETREERRARITKKN